MTKWLVKGLIPEGHVVLVVGQPGNLKSWWIAQLAIDIADGNGKHLDRFEVEKTHVIYIDEDTPVDTYEERLERLACFTGKKLEDLPIDCRPMQRFRLSDDKTRRALIADIKKLKTGGEKVLVIIDCLVKVFAGENMDTTGKGSEAMGYITELRDAGATVIVVHHMSLKKEADLLKMWDPMTLVLNSTTIVSSSDTAFTVFRVPVKSRTIFVIRPQARRLSLQVEEAFAVELVEDDQKSYALLFTIDEIPRLPSNNAKLIFQFFTAATTQLTVKEIDKKLQDELAKTQIRKALLELVEQKCLEREVNPHDRTHATWYKLHTDINKLNSFYKKYL